MTSLAETSNVEDVLDHVVERARTSEFSDGGDFET